MAVEKSNGERTLLKLERQFQGYDKCQAEGSEGSRQRGSDAKHIEVIESTGLGSYLDVDCEEEERCNDGFKVSILSNWKGDSGIRQSRKHKRYLSHFILRSRFKAFLLSLRSDLSFIHLCGFSVGYYNTVSEVYFISHYYTHQNSILLGE